MLRTRHSSVLKPVSQQNMFDVSSRETENMNAEGESMMEGIFIKIVYFKLIYLNYF